MRNANGEGTKSKTKTGLYCYRGFITMPDGKRKRVARTSTKSFKDAKDKWQTYASEVRQNIEIAKNADKQLRRWGEFWLAQYVRTGTKLNTYESYKHLLTKYVFPVMGDRIMDDITPMEWQQFFNHLIDEGLSPSSACNIRKRVSTLYKSAMDSGFASTNPIAKTKAPKAVKPDYRVLTAEEAKEFIKMAGEGDTDYYNHMMPVVYTLAIKTWMRKGEIFGLMWQDIDLVHRSIHVTHNLSNDEHNRPYISTLKTDSSQRIIMIDDNDIAILVQWHDWLKQHRETMGKNYLGGEHDVVFPSLKGTLMRFTIFSRRHFRPLCDRMGLPKHFTFHSLRHTCATLLLLADQHPKIVQERLGHSSISVTMDRYSQYIPSMQKTAVDAMASIFA